MSAKLLFHLPLTKDIHAVSAAGDPRGQVPAAAEPPTPEHDGIRPGMRFGRHTAVDYAVARNFARHQGTVMMWFKPDWHADYMDTLGRILWDLRIEYGSIVPDDPSQRWALVFPNPEGGNVGRSADTLNRWRWCLATDRNVHLIGTRQKRPDSRSRQAVWGERATFAADTWMHLAVTWTSREGAVFSDGREIGRDTLREGLPHLPLPASMRLGAVPSWINAGACGVLADLRIYDRALDAAAIAAIVAD